MRYSEDELVERLKRRVLVEKRREWVNPPVTREALDEAETALGFALPKLLKRVYMAVGNGGFGPGYGLFPLREKHLCRSDDDSLVTTYLERSTIPQEHLVEILYGEGEGIRSYWPEQFLIVCDWGCNIYSFLDCTNREAPVFRKDHNRSYSLFAVEAPSLHDWLEIWLENADAFTHLDWEKALKVRF